MAEGKKKTMWKHLSVSQKTTDWERPMRTPAVVTAKCMLTEKDLEEGKKNYEHSTRGWKRQARSNTSGTEIPI